MSIHTLFDKIKGRAGDHREKLIYMGVLTIVAASSFYLGYVARAEGRPEPLVAISAPAEAYMDSVALSEPTPKPSGQGTATNVAGMPYVASKNGTKYYPVACAGAKRIKEENKIGFASEAAAVGAGLALAAGCK